MHGISNDLQSDPIFLENSRLPTLANERGGVGASTTKFGEPRQIIPNFDDGCVPLGGVRFGGWEDFIRVHDPQLGEDALEWLSRNASNESTEGNGTEAESK